MKRKLVWSLVICLTIICLVLTSCAPATPAEEEVTPPKEAEVIHLKFASWDPQVGVIWRCFVDPWMQLINKETGGRVVIDFYASSTLVKPEDLYDALLENVADICVVGLTRTPGRAPLFEVNELPFLFDGSFIAGRSVWEAYQQGYYGDELKDIKVLGIRPNCPANISHRSKYIKTLEDLKGQRFNGTGWVATELAKALNTSPVNVPAGELYESLGRGMIEFILLEWEGQHCWKAYEVTKYRTAGCNVKIGATTINAMSWDTYNSLPPDIQAVFDKYTGLWLTDLTSANFDREDVWRYQWIQDYDKQRGNPPVYNLPAEERLRWMEASKVVRDKYVGELDAKGLPGTTLLNKLMELSEKYAAMFPRGSDAEYQMWQKYGKDSVFPGYPLEYVLPPR